MLLFAGVFAGVFLIKNNQIFKIGASPTITPKDVRISNISESSATVSWVTEDATTGFVTFGETSTPKTFVGESNDNQKFTTHSITITGLKPETNYFFKINSDGTNFDNNGVLWQFTTGKIPKNNQVSIPASGSLISSTGQPVGRAIVYVVINGYTLSTFTSESGNFVVQLGSARNVDLSDYANIDPDTTLLEISATSGTGEVATAKIFPRSANPIPAMILGQDQDFRNLSPSNSGINPGANLNLPQRTNAESKINITSEEPSAKSTIVTLKSIDDGEIITSDKPQFFGDGPTGEKITITIHSDTEITGTVTVSPKGTWNWTPPTNLSPGAHTVTVSWIDSSGITRTLTRSFIVQAGELPAFVASPSATPTQTPISTRTPVPTKTPVSTETPASAKSPTPAPTTTLKPTSTPKPVGSATPASLPESGALTPTLLLFIMGVGILAFSFYTWKVSKN